jgi:hypothetical protein
MAEEKPVEKKSLQTKYKQLYLDKIMEKAK